MRENQDINSLVKPAITLLIDADACPVKDEVYRVMNRYQLKTFVVANRFLSLPDEALVERVVVAGELDGADDWIVEHVHEASIVITSDIPLAARVVQAGGACLSPTGRIFDVSSIGQALAMRNLMEDLRGQGNMIGGPRPFCRKDRSAFLSALDLLIQRLKRRGY
ncbi:YaiI/YqxD family protein [Bartonella machadoae]|uniref:YaiI/YqxD family protein n=1 Tax=Bartonella machadoae TaxID=2893471 RepID=UPI001F4CCB47|nr:YaiI/YqxD family protein [Bartonella machadoae]UNE54149.1 YaiI/YqxD family protein [Bartonella machadoae]